MMQVNQNVSNVLESGLYKTEIKEEMEQMSAEEE